MPRWKRSTDITCALLALPILAVGALVMMTVTKLVSRGPVFFRQERVGLQGRRFTILKFRTMQVAADPTIHLDHMKQLMAANTPMAKLDGQRDPRLIPGGWMLRASGLDELPQVINVLRGEMSVVGPRPCLPGEFEQAQPAQRERVNAVPGLTGLWQVSGKNRTTFEEMIRLDVHYARNVALPLDIKIILLTPVALLRQIGDTRRQRQPAVRAVAVEKSDPVAVAPIAGARVS
ncbi:sugar transferase [Horticoccus sp. 23ND18S-11]|uniref:sugar transferase n=1 Tax=Horticoccus sp. 23ND18S-11 TaxID=3391832 RepID=UPI0039C8D2CE